VGNHIAAFEWEEEGSFDAPLFYLYNLKQVL